MKSGIEACTLVSVTERSRITGGVVVACAGSDGSVDAGGVGVSVGGVLAPPCLISRSLVPPSLDARFDIIPASTGLGCCFRVVGC